MSFHFNDLGTIALAAKPLSFEPEGKCHIVNRKKERKPNKLARRLRQQIDYAQKRGRPEDSQTVGQTAIGRAAARIDVADGHENQYGKDDDRKGIDPTRRLQDIDIKGNDVPVGGKTKKIMVRGFGFLLTKTIGAGNEWQRRKPQ